MNSLRSDIQLQLFPYVATDWVQRFPCVFPSLTTNRLTVVTPRAPEPVPSCASPVVSANMSAFPDLDLSQACVDAELAVLPTQVQWRPSPLVEQDEPVGSPTLSVAPLLSTKLSGHSAGPCTMSAMPSPSVVSVHPAERASADEVTSVLESEVAGSSSSHRHPACWAAVVTATLLAMCCNSFHLCFTLMPVLSFLGVFSCGVGGE